MVTRYEDRLRRVIRYIHDNPDGDLSLDALADVAALSRFHWHRIFHAMTGETCAEAVKRVRAHRASYWLAGGDLPIESVAARAGYGNVQSFTRAFRDVFGVTPAAFRKSGTPERAPLMLKTGENTMYDVTIQETPGHRLAALEHIGPYAEIGRTFDQLSAVFSAHQLWPQMRGLLAVYHDDPTVVAAEKLRASAGIAVEESFDMPSDLQELRVTGGRCAVLRLKGPYSGLQGAYEHIYGQWFATANEEPADAPPFEIYRNTPQDTAPPDLVTDICAPLKG